MGSSTSRVWHRCGVCGTIFANLDELREHLVTHDKHKGTNRLEKVTNATLERTNGRMPPLQATRLTPSAFTTD